MLITLVSATACLVHRYGCAMQAQWMSLLGTPGSSVRNKLWVCLYVRRKLHVEGDISDPNVLLCVNAACHVVGGSWGPYPARRPFSARLNVLVSAFLLRCHMCCPPEGVSIKFKAELEILYEEVFPVTHGERALISATCGD